MRKNNLKFCTVTSTKDSHQIPKKQISVAATLNKVHHNYVTGICQTNCQIFNFWVLVCLIRYVPSILSLSGKYKRLFRIWISISKQVWLLKSCKSWSFYYIFYIHVIWSFISVIYAMFMLYVLLYIYMYIICF